MVPTLLPILRIYMIATIGYNIAMKNRAYARTSTWSLIETLAESYPYIVALLNDTKNYTCTGSIINKRTVVTSGSCVTPSPKYIAVGTAIFSRKANPKNIFQVAYTVMHGEYTFELKAADPNVTRMHSNIGLVFAVRPVLDLFIPSTVIGNYYASELKEKKLTVIGFGKLNHSDVIVLQQQAYHQSPCANPKWYYCICGIEYSAFTRTNDNTFGEGAPVIYGSEVIGITASPCGLLTLKTIGIKYNIFTVIGPYMPWIMKSELNSTILFRARNCAQFQDLILMKYFIIVLVIIKMLI